MNQQTALRQLKALQSGAEKMRLAAEGWGSEWQTLIAIVMSARTRDETTIKVAEKLFAKYQTLSALARARAAEVRVLVRPVNFFRNKTKSVIGAAKTLVEYFGGTPPREISQLITIPGVGRKTANVFLTEVGQDAIGVDTHVAHISRMLGWTRETNAYKIESDLKELFPRKYWNEVNRACVHFGKTHQSRKKKDALLRAIAGGK